MTDRGFTDLDGGAPRLAHAPALLQAFMAGIAAFDATSLTPIEREVVILVLARDNGCALCTTMHRGIARKLGAGDVATAVLDRAPLTDPRLDALARLTAAMLATRGDVDAETWNAFLAAGYTRAQALEVLIGFGAYTMSTYGNRLTGA